MVGDLPAAVSCTSSQTNGRIDGSHVQQVHEASHGPSARPPLRGVQGAESVKNIDTIFSRVAWDVRSRDTAALDGMEQLVHCDTDPWNVILRPVSIM